MVCVKGGARSREARYRSGSESSYKQRLLLKSRFGIYCSRINDEMKQNKELNKTRRNKGSKKSVRTGRGKSWVGILGRGYCWQPAQVGFSSMLRHLKLRLLLRVFTSAVGIQLPSLESCAAWSPEVTVVVPVRLRETVSIDCNGCLTACFIRKHLHFILAR